MTTAKKIIFALVALGLVAAVGVWYAGSHPGSPVAGAINSVSHLETNVWWFTTTHYFGSAQQTSVSSTGALTVGTSGTAVGTLSWATCSLIASSFTVAASTTVSMDCANAGAVAGDFVLAQFGTTTVPGATTGGWRIVGVSASTTSGYDTLQVRNDTGASAIIPAQIASSTKVLNIR